MKLKLVKATLLKREKRFLSWHRLESGEEVCAHCPNPGSMRGNAEAGSETRLFDYGAGAKDRKLRYRWQLVKSGKAWVCIDTSIANGLVASALASGEIDELAHIKDWQAEQSFHDARFDFAAALGKKKFFLEVKSVSMAEGSRALFPDSVTTRGQKHLETLMKAKKVGHEAALLFLVKRSDCKDVAAARAIDPVYADLLKKAHKAGVQVFCRALDVTPSSLTMGNAMELVYV